MRDCMGTTTDIAPLDPNKRVNYTFGMVLGVKDFRQEQEHFEWKHRAAKQEQRPGHGLPHRPGLMRNLHHHAAEHQSE